MTDAAPPCILVDADACPVKDEIYRVAARYGLTTFIVANAFILIPKDTAIERIVVPAGPDVADDWIAGRARSGDIVVTSDIPLAARCVAAGASVIAPDGRLFTENSIGMAVAARNLHQDLREAGVATRGPKPFDRRARSAFLSALDGEIVKVLRRRVVAPPANPA